MGKRDLLLWTLKIGNCYSYIHLGVVFVALGEQGVGLEGAKTC